VFQGWCFDGEDCWFRVYIVFWISIVFLEVVGTLEIEMGYVHLKYNTFGVFCDLGLIFSPNNM
jgi:accessory gene regulator protein AgrB